MHKLFSLLLGLALLNSTALLAATTDDNTPQNTPAQTEVKAGSNDC